LKLLVCPVSGIQRRGETTVPNRATILVPAALLLQAAPTHAAAGPRVLAPVSDWTLDFADERCSLIREFADGDETMRLEIVSFGPRPGYRVTLSGGLVAGSDAAPLVEYRVGYSPDTGERERMQAIAGKLGDENAVAYANGFLPMSWTATSLRETDDAVRAFERGITHMTVEFRNRRPFQLATGSMAAPFAAMRRCVDDLISSWGVDPVKYRALSRLPLRDLGGDRGDRVFTGGDPPALTRRSGEPVGADERLGPVDRRARTIASLAYHSARSIPVRVMIDANGQASACVVQVATTEEFRQRACESLMGAYEPALDAEGRPVASVFQVEIG
jgi:hypothetical protein